MNILLHTPIAGFALAFAFGLILAQLVAKRWCERIFVALIFGFTSMVTLEAIRLALKGAL
jgi:hypothetical protein